MLAFGFSVSDFITDAFSAIFISMLDNAVYAILAYTYRIWIAITKLDIFGGSDAGKLLYDGFSSRIYTAIGIIMVFIFGYRLLMYIMDPDGSYSSKVKSSAFIRKILFSIILVIVAPLLFRYMAIFQYHVVSNGTITNIVLGADGAGEKLDSGKQLAMVTMMGFYHPYGTTYNTFVVDQSSDTCRGGVIKDPSSFTNVTQQLWAEAMVSWCEDEDAITPNKILWNSDIRKSIGDEGGSEYFWVICTPWGVIVIYFLIQYCIAVGTRAVRLAFLELIAPVPILLRMFDESKFFNPWLDEMKKTYLELFVRIAIISFVIYLCTLVPTFIDLIAGAF